MIKSLSLGRDKWTGINERPNVFFQCVTLQECITHELRLPLVLPLLVRRVCVLGTHDQLKEFRYMWPAQNSLGGTWSCAAFFTPHIWSLM